MKSHQDKVLQNAQKIMRDTLIPMETKFEGESGEAVLWAVTVWLASLIASEDASVESVIDLLRAAAVPRTVIPTHRS